MGKVVQAESVSQDQAWDHKAGTPCHRHRLALATESTLCTLSTR